MKNLLILNKTCIHRLALTILLSLPVLLFGQNALSGELLDDFTGKPVSGALVKIADSYRQTISDENGNFYFSGLKNEKITLYISHVSYDKDTVLTQVTSEKLYIRLNPYTYISQEITVTATRATSGSAVAYYTINKPDLEISNLGQDLPYLLQMSPSLVVTSDAGNGIGYTGLRIRGSDASRINVTINGVPVNDAESHQVYWVDLPDLASSTENIQIQRGVGTSTNGAGAFGGSVNIQTLKLTKNPYASISSSAGSFQTFKNTVGFGTGLLSNHYSIDGKISMIQSDGFIDRASGNLKSFFLSGGYYGKTSSIKAVIMSGKEKTYQAWYGVPQDSLKSNRTFNPAGMYFDANGEMKFYDDQTDNYQQDNYQLHYSKTITGSWNFNLTLHGTLGKGYYEEFSAGDPFSKYSLPDLIAGTDTIQNSDFIRQRWLANNFYGAIASTNYEGKKIKMIIGAAANKYNGNHYGELIWSKDQVIPTLPHRYYEDDAQKEEMNLFAKISSRIFNKLDVFVDVQLRNIHYQFEGRETGGLFLPQSVNYSFFNPKIGFSYSLPKDQRVYLSVGVGQKEPVRDDFINSSAVSRPESEMMTDYEAGYRLNSEMLNIGLNIFYMDYQDQLILNGKINDVGEYTRQNVAESYRSGVELEFGYLISNSIRFEGNICLSQNKIEEFEEYIDDYDTEIQILRRFSSIDIAFSPSLIASAQLSWKPFQALNIDFTGKYVGKQFLDNTESQSKSIDAYLLNDMRLRYTFQLKSLKEIGLIMQVNNIFNQTYNSNGYTYSYIYGGEMSTFNYYYPQAGRNFMAGINLLF